MRTSTVLGSIALAIFSNQVLATPPACLLACVAEVSKNSNKCNALNEIGCICGESSTVHDCLNSKCPNGNSGEAWNSFQSSCQGKSSGSSSSAASSSTSAPSSSSTSSKASSSSSPSSSSTSSKAASSGTNSGASSKATEVASTKASSSPSSTAGSGATHGGSTVETHVVTSTGEAGPVAQTNYVTKHSTVFEGVTNTYTVTSTGSPVTKTVQGGTVLETTTCSTTLGKRDATKTVSSSSSGAANVLQVGSAAMVAAAALLI